MDIKEKAIHINLTLTLNEDASWSYKSPKVEKTIQFSLPLEMLTAKLFGDYVEKAVNGMKENWGKAVAEDELERAEEERKKAEMEAVKVSA